MTHDQLVQIAKRWLSKVRKCGVVIAELKSYTAEIPDVIGFRDGGSILIECKLSRADFLADAKKPFRTDPGQGMGTYRFYLCPTGIITIEDLPDKWGLLWVDEKGKCHMQRGPSGNIWSVQKEFYFSEKNYSAEQTILVSALRRLQTDSP